jgi:hypothetical protein
MFPTHILGALFLPLSIFFWMAAPSLRHTHGERMAKAIRICSAIVFLSGSALLVIHFLE